MDTFQIGFVSNITFFVHDRISFMSHSLFFCGHTEVCRVMAQSGSLLLIVRSALAYSCAETLALLLRHLNKSKEGLLWR